MPPGSGVGRIEPPRKPSNPVGQAGAPAPARAAVAADTPADVPQPTDDEAVERACRGDHEAFRVLVERYQARVFRVALRVLRDEEQARDAVQEAFLRVYRSLRSFEGRSSFYTWLYRVVLNLCLDMRRRSRSERPLEGIEPPGAGEDALGGAGAMSAPAPGPDVALERAQLRKAVAAAIEALPDEARQTLVLREVDGLSYAEIAKMLDIPKGTVMSRLHYARRRLQKALIAAGAVEVAPEPGATAGADGGDA